MSRWFRHYAGMMRDDKLVRASIKAKQSVERVLWVWGALLESAAEIDDGGRYDFDVDEASYFLRADAADIRAVLGALEAVGRIDGVVVVKWGDRQFQSDRSAERQQRYRQRKKADVGGDERQHNGDGTVTSLSRHGDAPETETEAESSVPNGTGAPAPLLTLVEPAPSPVPKPEPPGRTQEQELFARGREVLGDKQGGSLTAKLLKAKGGSVPLARAALEQASTKDRPAEYLGAVLRGQVQAAINHPPGII